MINKTGGVEPTSKENVSSRGVASKEMLKFVEELENKCLDLEQSNQVLKKYKRIAKAAESIKCRGCQKQFKPMLMGAHLPKCAKSNAEDDS